MKVSVVIPTYNRGYIIREAIESAIRQQYQRFEIIIVDDGSTDDTRQIVEALGNSRVRYVSHGVNRGCSAAYNTGILAATGDFISFLDSDDVWQENYLERQVSFLSSHPEVDVVFCNTEISASVSSVNSLMSMLWVFPKLLRANSNEAGEYVFNSRQMYLCLLEEVPIKPSAVVIRRQILDRVGLFDEGSPSGTDWDLFLRLARVARFGYIDQMLTTQRRTADATHQKFRENDKVFLLHVFLKEKAILLNDRKALRAVNRGICGLYNSLAWAYLESGLGKKALVCYCRGFTETWQLKMLRKIASAVIRITLSRVTKSGCARV